MELIRAEVGIRFCRRCGYCEPCPEGVHISTIMNLESLWRRLPAGRMSAGWVAQAVESADNCIECGECEAQCPYQLPIREMIVESIAFYENALQRAG